MNPLEHLPARLLTRRQMLGRMGTGLGMLGFAALMRDAGLLVPTAGAASANPLAPKAPQFPARAKRIIHIYLNGGPSQVDTFDPKPALARWANQTIPTGNLTTERPTGAAALIVVRPAIQATAGHAPAHSQPLRAYRTSQSERTFLLH